MKLIGNIGKEYIDGKDRDVRIELKRAFQVGASVQEACDFVGVPLATYEDWEYTYNELSKIKSILYSYKLTNYTDITDIIVEENINNINLELLNKLKKNPIFGNDVYKLIESCNKAKAEVIIYHLTNIYKPKKKDTDWKASAWYLERTNPDRYGRNPNIDDKDTTIDKISIEFIDPTKQDTQDRLKALEQEVKDSLNGNKD